VGKKQYFCSLSIFLPSFRSLALSVPVIELGLFFAKYLRNMATPGGCLTYGSIFSSRPFFVAVTLDQDDSKIFRLVMYGPHKWIFACRTCYHSISTVDGTVYHLSSDHPKTPCRNQIEDALASTHLWAEIRANEEAKASGRPPCTFTVEDWNRWLQVAGFHQENMTEDHRQLALSFINKLDAWPAERLRKLMDRINIGENLVRSTNSFPTWNLRSLPSPEAESSAANETPTLPRRKKKKSSESSQEEPSPCETSPINTPPPQIETIDISGERLIHYIDD
jgi:hypothetical protein